MLTHIHLGTGKCLVFSHMLVYSCAVFVDERSVSGGEGGLLGSLSGSQATGR